MTKQHNLHVAGSSIEPETRQEKIDTPASRSFVMQDQPFAVDGAAFWRPRHMFKSPVLASLPFIFWAIEALRPKRYVQIGFGDGLIYLAMCQAAERLNLDATGLCLEADSETLSCDTAHQHDVIYADFSRLLQDDLSSAAEQIDGDIDILVLNQPMASESVEALKALWLPRLSNQAVILVCGADRVFVEPTLRKTWLLEDKILAIRSLSGAKGQEVEVLLVGDRRNEALAQLATRRSAYLAARKIFTRLGKGLQSEQAADELQRQHDAVVQELIEVQTSLSVQIEKTDATEQALKNLEDAKQTQVDLQGSLQVQLYDQAQLLEQRAAEIASLKTGVRMLKTDLEAKKRDHEDRIEDIALLQKRFDSDMQEMHVKLTSMANENDKLTQNLNKSQAEHEERVEDIAVLMQKLQEEKQAQEAQYAEELNKQEQLLQELRTQKMEIENELNGARAYQDELLASTSWRLTKPFRKLKLALQPRNHN